jgi:hypothetical protein
MEILEAFDLTGSLRDAAEFAGRSHHTVARYVAAREAGGLCDRAAACPQLIDEFLPKVEESMEHSAGKIRADMAQRSSSRWAIRVRSGPPGARWRRCGGRSRSGGCRTHGRTVDAGRPRSAAILR